jgi:lipid-binding SYLF domain-containing protein
MMFISAMAILALASTGEAQTISGDYIETRSADVWTGPCVANGEVNLAGDQAILAWHVSRGAWKGVSLEGLSVVGVVKANATLGDEYNNPYPAKAVVIVGTAKGADRVCAIDVW